jgi:tetratricopeptide (TPR) repeat protein
VLAPGGELPATDVPAAKRGDAELERKLPTLRAPSDARPNWGYAGKDRKLLAPLEAAYAQLIADADETEIATAYLNRAGFRQGVGDFAGAKEDLDKAIEREASQDLYYRRAAVRTELGDLEGSLADWREGEALGATGITYQAQIELLGLLGRADEGLALAEDFTDLAETPSQARQMDASAMMWAGDKQQALAVLAEEAAKRPGDPALLNARCWEAGIWQVADEDTLDACTGAVEKSDWSAPALDSRAMVYYRLGRLDEARADLDAVVRGSPSLAASRYMRGIVRLAQGDEGGAKDIATALRMQPSLKRLYAAYGIEP